MVIAPAMLAHTMHYMYPPFAYLLVKEAHTKQSDPPQTEPGRFGEGFLTSVQPMAIEQ